MEQDRSFGRPTAVTTTVRTALLAGIVALVVACGPFTMPIADSSRIVVDSTVGPGAPQPIHGLSMTAELSTVGRRSVRTWDPMVAPEGIAVVPGDYRVAVWIAPPANTTLCIDGPDPATSGCFSGAGPPLARCELNVTIPPVAVVTIAYAAVDVRRCRLELESVAT